MSVPLHWIEEQQILKCWLTHEIVSIDTISHVIGLDISYIKDTDKAVCTGVILSYANWSLVDSISQIITVTEPYVAGYLAFREIDHYLALYRALKAKHPDKCNDLIVTDGNGILHPEGFGLACHLGVILQIPTIGCAKNLHHIDGLNKNIIRNKMDTENCNIFLLQGNSGRKYGYAVRGRGNINPVYVSCGHKVSVEAVRQFISRAFIVREPEPTRVADRLSREWIRNNLSAT